MIMNIFISIYFKIGDNMMTKKEAVYKLIELSKIQGEHNGRWEFEAIDYSSDVYFEAVTSLADTIGFEYAKGEEFQAELKEYEEECANVYDGWTFDLKEKIEDYLINIILGDNDE